MSARAAFTHEEILPIIRGVSLCILLAALDQTIVVPAVPRMARDLGGGHYIAWVVSAYLLTGTAATPIFGKLSDIYGRKALLQPALAIFCAASLGCALADNFWTVVAMRAIQGIGGAGLMTIAQTAISDVAPPRERGRYQIYMSGTWGIASIAGPMLGGALTDSISWRGIFWINLPVGAVAWVLAGRALARLPPHSGAERRIDWFGALLLVAAITGWMVICSAGGADFPWVSSTTLALVALAAGLTWAAAWQEGRALAPMIPLRLFANRTVYGGLLLSATNALCTFGGSLLLPLFFQGAQHRSAAVAGLLTTPMLMSFVVFSYVGAKISRALGKTRLTMMVAQALCIAGLALLATIGPGTSVVWCDIYSVLLGSGIGLVQPNITVAIQNAAERRDVGIATGCMLLFRAIGGAAGATLAGAVLLAAGFHAAFAVCAGVAVVALGVAGVMGDADLRRV